MLTTLGETQPKGGGGGGGESRERGGEPRRGAGGGGARREEGVEDALRREHADRVDRVGDVLHRAAEEALVEVGEELAVGQRAQQRPLRVRATRRESGGEISGATTSLLPMVPLVRTLTHLRGAGIVTRSITEPLSKAGATDAGALREL